MFDITKVNWKKVGIFASGVLFGTAGIKALSSKDAKNVYTNCTAAVLRAKDCVMKTATNIQENAEDIYAEAKNINEERAAEMEEFSDADTAAEAEEEMCIRDSGTAVGFLFLIAILFMLFRPDPYKNQKVYSKRSVNA